QTCALPILVSIPRDISRFQKSRPPRRKGLISRQNVKGRGSGGRPKGRPPFTVREGTSFFDPLRLLFRVSTNSTGPSTRSKIATSAGAPTLRVPRPGTPPLIFARPPPSFAPPSPRGIPRV